MSHSSSTKATSATDDTVHEKHESTPLITNGDNTHDGQSSQSYRTNDVEKEDDDCRSSSLSPVSATKEGALSLWTIACILSTSFAYGCIMTTLFLITLPVECERIEEQHPTVPKSVRRISWE